jgi:hypothetical protein
MAGLPDQAASFAAAHNMAAGYQAFAAHRKPALTANPPPGRQTVMVREACRKYACQANPQNMQTMQRLMQPIGNQAPQYDR